MAWTKWTDDEIKFITENYKTGNIPEMAATLNRSVDSVKCRVSKLGIVNGRGVGRCFTPKRWTKDDDFMLRCLYPHTFPQVLAVYFNATKNAVCLRAALLGVKKSRAVYQYIRKKHQPELYLLDKSIVVNSFQIKDPEAVAEFIALYPELIELKRNEIKLNGKLRQLKAGIAKPGG